MFRFASILGRKQLCNLFHGAKQGSEISTALISPRTPDLQSSMRCLCSDGGSRTDGPPPSLPSEDDHRYDFESGLKRVYPPLIDDVCRILRDVNAIDTCVIEVPPERHYLKYVVIVCGKSSRHLRAMSTYLVSQYKQSHVGPRSLLVYGRKAPEWMIVEFSNMIIHFLSNAERERLELEKLWALGATFDDQYSAMSSMRTEEKLWPDGKKSSGTIKDEAAAVEDYFEEEEGDEEELEEEEEENGNDDAGVTDDLHTEESFHEDLAEEAYYEKEAREYDFEADEGGFQEQNMQESVKTRMATAKGKLGKNVHNVERA